MNFTTLSAPLMIVGDFNIYVDDLTDIHAGKLHDIIYMNFMGMGWEWGCSQLGCVGWG